MKNYADPENKDKPAIMIAYPPDGRPHEPYAMGIRNHDDLVRRAELMRGFRYVHGTFDATGTVKITSVMPIYTKEIFEKNEAPSRVEAAMRALGAPTKIYDFWSLDEADAFAHKISTIDPDLGRQVAQEIEFLRTPVDTVIILEVLLDGSPKIYTLDDDNEAILELASSRANFDYRVIDYRNPLNRLCHELACSSPRNSHRFPEDMPDEIIEAAGVNCDPVITIEPNESSDVEYISIHEYVCPYSAALEALGRDLSSIHIFRNMAQVSEFIGEKHRFRGCHEARTALENFVAETDSA